MTRLDGGVLVEQVVEDESEGALLTKQMTDTFFTLAAHVCVIFFFQAEDGIRDLIVTGVQTCALPISPPRHLSVDTWVRDGQVSVAVGDNGRGVAPDIAPRLFRPFATTKGRRGTGLGLYISRQIAREAGGDLTLTSPPGFGARFVLSLPLALAQASAPDSATSPAPAPAPALAPSTPPSASPLRGAGGAQAPAGSLAGLRVR